MTRRVHELVDGEIRSMPFMGGQQSLAAMAIGTAIFQFTLQNAIGVVFSAGSGHILRRSPDTVLAPDVSFVCKSRFSQLAIPRTFIPFAPDLAVEVIGPDDTVNEIAETTHRWIGSGTRLVWIVSVVERSVRVYSPSQKPFIVTEGETLSGADVVPGFSMAVSEIFD